MTLSDDYIAGLFDGEGWISFARYKNRTPKQGKRLYRFQLTVNLVMREKEIIDKLAEQYGGTVTVMPPRAETHSTCYKWFCVGVNAHNFLQTVVVSKCIAKRKQGLVGIKICELKHQQGNRSMTDEEYVANELLWEEMRQLNMKGQGK